MLHRNPIPCRLTEQQIAWLDAQRVGAVCSRSEAIRHAVQYAMEHQYRINQRAIRRAQRNDATAQ
jgi:Arc/MetJ-type ribon-helix-helix transcriptional regulator